MSYSLLIVDDSATTRAFIRRTLRMADIETNDIYEASDGMAALQLLKLHHVDLVLADLHMPIMDGVEMARRILADETLKHIPMLVVSVDPNTDRLEQLCGAGIAGYIRKPFTPESFRAALVPILEAARA